MLQGYQRIIHCTSPAPDERNRKAGLLFSFYSCIKDCKVSVSLHASQPRETELYTMTISSSLVRLQLSQGFYTNKT